MKATEIKVTIQRSGEWGDKVWIGAAYSLDDGEDVKTAVKAAKDELDQAYINMSTPTVTTERVELKVDSKIFPRLKNDLKAGKITVTEILKQYTLTSNVLKSLEE